MIMAYLFASKKIYMVKLGSLMGHFYKMFIFFSSVNLFALLRTTEQCHSISLKVKCWFIPLFVVIDLSERQTFTEWAAAGGFTFRVIINLASSGT